ncbi:MAG: cytochrome c biogenesis protein CcsA [Longimicrobiales bacterium]
MAGRTGELPRLPRWVGPFGVFTFGFLILSQAIAVLSSPPEAGMGDLQKIMYVHLPAAWNAMLAPAFVLIWSLLYLWKGEEKYDLLAAAAAEVSTVLIGLTLALGMIWAKPTWGVWWDWDPRLTSTAILFLIFVGYLALRAFTEDDERRGRWSAAVGILGAINVPIVYMSVRWWRTLHQPQSTPETVDAIYVLGMRLNAFAFLFIVIFFIAMRYHVARLERAEAMRSEERALSEGAVHV